MYNAWEWHFVHLGTEIFVVRSNRKNRIYFTLYKSQTILLIGENFQSYSFIGQNLDGVPHPPLQSSKSSKSRGSHKYN